MPPQFFQYATAAGINILKDLRIKVSNAHELNDPFEMMPRVDSNQMTVENLMIMIMQDHHIDDAYSREAGRLGFTSRESFEKYYLSTLKQRAENLESDLKANEWQVLRTNAEELKRFSAKSFSEHFKLVCGSAVENSILMWSHYAEKHSGIVVEFDLTKPPFSLLPDTEIIDVDYRDERVELTIPFAGKRHLEEINCLTRTKASAWSYEKEIRIELLHSMCPMGNFLQVTGETIKGVILGCRASDKLILEASQQKKRPELSHIYIKRAVLHPDKFQLDFELLDNATPAP